MLKYLSHLISQHLFTLNNNFSCYNTDGLEAQNDKVMVVYFYINL